MYSNSDSVFVDDNGRPLQLRFLWRCSCLHCIVGFKGVEDGFLCFINTLRPPPSAGVPYVRTSYAGWCKGQKLPKT